MTSIKANSITSKPTLHHQDISLTENCNLLPRTIRFNEIYVHLPDSYQDKQ
jgi:hypothetical protein